MKKFDRLQSAIKISVLWSSIFWAIVGILFSVFPVQIISQFTKNDLQMIETGAKALRANGISFLFFGFHTVYASLFLALGRGREDYVLGACRQGICFVPIIVILPKIMKLDGILYAQPAADFLTVAVTGVMAVFLYRNLNALQRNRC